MLPATLDMYLAPRLILPMLGMGWYKSGDFDFQNQGAFSVSNNHFQLTQRRVESVNYTGKLSLTRKSF